MFKTVLAESESMIREVLSNITKAVQNGKRWPEMLVAYVDPASLMKAEHTHNKSSNNIYNNNNDNVKT